jgi:hypothetical protein
MHRWRIGDVTITKIVELEVRVIVLPGHSHGSRYERFPLKTWSKTSSA